jgi:hypothetical protein
METNAKKVQQIGELATRVGRAHEAHDQAWRAKRAADADLLVEVIEKVRPGLRAICSRVAASGTRSSAGVTTEPAVFRGVLLAGDNPVGHAGPTSVAGPTENGVVARGRYGGTDLFLTEAGSLVQLRYSGNWSTVPGEVSRWGSEVVGMNAAEAAIEYPLDELMDHLAAALATQAEGATPRRIAQLSEQAERVRALLTLVRSST